MRIYPWEGDNSWKRLLIPRKPGGKRCFRAPPMVELMSYQLVGEVTAHQGDDG